MGYGNRNRAQANRANFGERRCYERAAYIVGQLVGFDIAVVGTHDLMGGAANRIEQRLPIVGKRLADFADHFFAVARQLTAVKVRIHILPEFQIAFDQPINDLLGSEINLPIHIPHHFIAK